VHFDQQVKGITAANLALRDVTSSTVVPPLVPATVLCKSVFLPGSYSSCAQFADTAILQPSEPLVQGRTYNVRINIDDAQGIVAIGLGELPLRPFEQQFTGNFVVLDKTPPVASPTLSPAANANGWNSSAVTVTWNWSDGSGSGLDPAQCPATSTSSGVGPAVVISGSCTDVAGNTASASRVVKVDTTAPTLAPTISPSPLLVGSTATANPNATDPVSGLTSSSCATVDTTRAGARSLTCTAVDLAGNSRSVSVAYVVGFGVAAIFPPPRSSFKAGANVPIRFQLVQAGGQTIPASVASSLPTCAARVTAGTSAPVCATYDPVANRFQANVRLPDGLKQGAVVPIDITVTLGGTTVASGGTSLLITK
jgi:hypothetical protein